MRQVVPVAVVLRKRSSNRTAILSIPVHVHQNARLNRTIYQYLVPLLLMALAYLLPDVSLFCSRHTKR